MSSIEPRRTLIFWLPLAYFFVTRFASGAAVASWIFIYPVPIVLGVACYRLEFLDLQAALALLLSMLATYGVYELGYMDNDVRTTRREANPTERLSDAEKTYYESRYWVIVGMRLATVAALIVGVRFLLPDNETGPMLLLVSLLVIAAVFPIYNSTRGRINLPLHVVLVACRFCMPGLVAVGFGHLEFAVVMFSAFPLINLLERSGEARYELSAFQPVYRYRDRVRVGYYVAVLTISLGLWFNGSVSLGAIVVPAWFLVYRSSALLFASRYRSRV